MFVTELDTFVKKFHQLWNDGFTAHLDLDTQAGNAWVGLRVQLGQVPGPPHHHPLPRSHGQTHQVYRGPAYQRRQEKRQAARAAAGNVAPHLAEEASDACAHDTVEEVSTQNTVLAEEANAISSETKDNENEAVKAKENFECLECGFKSNWENGLKIHLTRKHTKIEQVDGSTMDSDDETYEDDKYLTTKFYWEKGKLGTGYQVFMDANDIIDQSELSKDDKEKEKLRVLEARKIAFGARFRDYPPWNLKS